MTERSTRELPAYVWIAVIGCLALHLVSGSLMLAGLQELSVMVATWAAGTAAAIVVAVAATHLRRSMSGAMAFGASLAAWSMAGAIGLEALQAIFLNGVADPSHALFYLDWLLRLGSVAGLVLAAKRSPTLAVAGALLALGDLVPPFAREWIYNLSEHQDLGVGLMDVLSAIGWTGILLLLIGAVHGPRTVDPALARSGFTLAARAVWLRVLGMAAGVMIGLSLAGRAGPAIPYMMFGAMALSMASSMLFGIGLLRASDAGIADLPRGLIGVAGVLALWCGGVALVQLPWVHELLIQRRDFAQDLVAELSLVQPIVAVLSVALFAASVAGFAHARGDGALASRARGTGVAFVLLMILVLFLQRVDGSQALDTALFPLLATVLGVAAQIALGQMCTAAARAMDAQPGIPTATVLK